MQLWGNDLKQLPDHILINLANTLDNPETASKLAQVQVKEINKELECRWQYTKGQLESYEQEYQ